MKKITYIFLAISLILIISGCNSSNKNLSSISDKGLDTSDIEDSSYNSSDNSQNEQVIPSIPGEIKNQGAPIRENKNEGMVIDPEPEFSLDDVIADVSVDNSDIKVYITDVIRNSGFYAVPVANKENCGEVTFYMEAPDDSEYIALVKDVIVNGERLRQCSTFVISNGHGFFTVYWVVDPENTKKVDIKSFSIELDISLNDIVKYSRVFDISNLEDDGKRLSLID